MFESLELEQVYYTRRRKSSMKQIALEIQNILVKLYEQFYEKIVCTFITYKERNRRIFASGLSTMSDLLSMVSAKNALCHSISNSKYLYFSWIR